MADASLYFAAVVILLFGLSLCSGYTAGDDAIDVVAQRPSFQATESRLLFAFRSYRDVQILHYSVPELTSMVTWEFRSNATSRCATKKIVVHLQYGGYPVVSPRNATFPPLVVVQRNSLHTVSCESDNVPVVLNISVPLPGDWFAIAYVDEDSDKIVQKGLFQNCDAWLRSHVKYYSEETYFSLVPGIPHHQTVFNHHYFRFYAPENVWSANVALSKCSWEPQEHKSECPVSLYARARALPTEITHDSESNCTQAVNDSCELRMVPAESDWNYILVQVAEGVTRVDFEIIAGPAVCQHQIENLSEVADVPQHSTSKLPKFVKPKNQRKKFNTSSTSSRKKRLALEELSDPEELQLETSPSSVSCWPQVPLVRNNLPGNFAFRYDQVPNENGTTTIAMNVTSDVLSLMKFDIEAMVDSGGTLAIELVLAPGTNTTQNNVSVQACLNHSLRPPVTPEGDCLSGITFNVNSSSKAYRAGAIMVPYPEAGRWYLSLQSNCYVGDNDSSSIEVGCSSNFTTVYLQIKSAACILGHCGAYGNCYQYISGGFIFSTCVCKAGWRGWGCTDSSEASSDGQLLLAVLLLTLSNIVFLPAVILAIYRRYFTEALVYLVTMVFSTMYHACDADVFSMCLMRLSVLQFCDFYSAILAVWVTLLAMADLPATLLSLAHMAGAVGVALGVEYDRTGLWVFIVPVAMGLIILLVSWVHHCSRQRSCYPRGRTWLACLLPGVATAALGLALFAFLETRRNYQYVHSGWHAAMAISILFLLPERRKVKGRKGNRDEEVNTCSYVRVEELSDISPSEEYQAYEQLLPRSP